MVIKKPFFISLFLMFALSNNSCATLFEDVNAKRKVEQLESLSKDFKLHKNIYSEFNLLFNADILRINQYVSLTATDIEFLKSLSERFFVPPTRILFLFLVNDLPNINLESLNKTNPELARKVKAIYDLHSKLSKFKYSSSQGLFEQRYLEFPIESVSNEFLTYILDFKPLLHELMCNCKHNVLKEHVEKLLREPKHKIQINHRFNLNLKRV